MTSSLYWTLQWLKAVLIRCARHLASTCASLFCHTQVLCNVLVCLRLEVMWSLRSLDVNNPSADTVKWLKARLQHLVEQCHELVKFGSVMGQREAFVTLCDLLIMFAKQLNNIGMFNPLIPCMLWLM